MLSAGYIEIKHTVSAQQAHSGMRKTDKRKDRVEMQDYGDLYRAGVHTKVTMRPFVRWGEGSLRKLKTTLS